MSDFDTMLWRPIRSGDEFGKLFPSSKCQKSYVGEGYTDFSVDQMQDVVEEYSWQAAKVAQLLDRDSIEETARAVHEFLYNYFQYKADDADQMLRSPACSWASRYDGIDCKSYSIIASCLLLEMGISHYIRRIKQPGYEPTEYTHVYVVVPINQETANLSQGYYTVDGTIPTMNEPPFVAKDDLFMSGLKHYSLNGSADNGSLGFSVSDAVNVINTVSGSTTSNNASSSSSDGNNTDFLKQTLESVQKLLPSWVKCIGGTAFNSSRLESVHTGVQSFFDDLVTEMNTNLGKQDYTAFSQNVAEYQAATKMLVTGFQTKLAQKWNACSTDNFNWIIDYTTFLRDTGGKALQAYLDAYFTKPSGLSAVDTTSSSIFQLSPRSSGIDLTSLLNVVQTANPVNTATRTVAFPNTIFQNYDVDDKSVIPQGSATYINYTPRAGASIPQFKLTAYVAKNKDAFNATDYLKTLGQLTDTVYHIAGGTTATGTDLASGVTQDANATKQAGFGIAGWLMLGVGLSIAFSKMKDTGEGAKASKTANESNPTDKK